MANNKNSDTKKNDDFADRLFKFGELLVVDSFKFLITSSREAYLGYMNGLMPVVRLLQLSCTASLFFSLKLDLYFLKILKYWIPMLQLPAPTGLFRVIIWLACAVSPFLFWGWRRHKIIQAVILYLQDTFTSAGLVSNNKTPRLIRDYATETDSRVLQFLSDGVTVSQFKEKKELLENKLSVRIEEIRGNKQFPKLVEIEFANAELKTVFELSDIYGYKDFTFPIGMTRSEVIIGDLKKTPHYLFAGRTGSGKSTFIKTMATILLANNEDLKIYLIDLKGTEAGQFISLPRLTATTEPKGALHFIEAVEKEINFRKIKFQKEKAFDINFYNKRMIDNGCLTERLPRILLIVDEMANLMPQLATKDFATLKKASLLLNWISRTGRSFGVHLAVGLQKPDTRNMDSTTKANLEGILCFQVADRTQSQVVLDNNLAASLGGIVGRAVWQTSGDGTIVQAPIISTAAFKKFVEENSNDRTREGEKNIVAASERSRNSEGTSQIDEDSSWTKINT